MKLFSFFLFFSISLSVLAKEVVDKIIASVGTEIVLASDLRAVQVRANKPGSIEEVLLLGDSLESLKSSKEIQLNFLVREKLIESEIKRLGLAVTEDQVNAELSQMAKKNQLSPAEFSSYLSKHGYDLDDYKRIMKSRIERQSFFEKEIISKLRITDEDAMGCFKQNI